MSMDSEALASAISDAIDTQLAGFAGGGVTSAEARTALATAIAESVIAHITANAEVDLGDGSIS